MTQVQVTFLSPAPSHLGLASVASHRSPQDLSTSRASTSRCVVCVCDALQDAIQGTEYSRSTPTSRSDLLARGFALDFRFPF